MRKLVVLCATLFLTSLVSTSLPNAAWAQAAGVSVRKLPNIREDMEAFPRVVSGAAVQPQIAAKINASLDRFDRQVRKDWRDCQKAAHGNGDWSRSIQVTMSGPVYLSFLANETYDCGNAHPEDIETALVYDLQTGSPVNWSALLPPAAKGEVMRAPGRLSLGVVHWAAMLERAKQQSMKGDGGEDCGSAYESPEAITFNVYLSATDHALALSPNLVPHIFSAMCSTVVLLKPEEAAKLGVAASLVSALKTAR